MENIKWVFKCIKRHVALINTLGSWQLCPCAVKDHLSKEQSYHFEYVLKRCFVEAFFLLIAEMQNFSLVTMIPEVTF